MAPASWWRMPCHPSSLPDPGFSLRPEKLGGGCGISWHRGDAPGLPTEPWSGGLADVPPWWDVQGELEVFLGFPKLGAGWFSAPSFWSSAVCAFGSPLVQSSGCLASVFPQFRSRWLPTLSSP